MKSLTRLRSLFLKYPKLCIVCVIILHTLVYIHNFTKNTSNKMQNKQILIHLGVINSIDDFECIEECDC